ncbi:MAG: Slp family lipoprotein [Nitrospirota bacterium]
MKRCVVLSAVTLLLQCCTYAISPEMSARADKTISFEMIQADPDTFKGKLVILGGTIAQTSNTRQGTVIEVVQRPLDYWGKPKRTDRTGGRFLVLSSRYLDSMIFAPGREITVAAEVEGTRSKALGEADYSYPVVAARELKLWERERKSWDTPQWTDPLNDPYYPARQDW